MRIERATIGYGLRGWVFAALDGIEALTVVSDAQIRKSPLAASGFAHQPQTELTRTCKITAAGKSQRLGTGSNCSRYRLRSIRNSIQPQNQLREDLARP
jgi:hypothetical protein